MKLLHRQFRVWVRHAEVLVQTMVKFLPAYDTFCRSGNRSR